MFDIFGDKTSAIFDLWSIVHFLTGISIGSLFFNASFLRTTPKAASITPFQALLTNIFSDLLMVFLLAVVWEAIEFFGEVGYFGADIAYWFRGVEFYLNRLIDPFLVLLGYLWVRTHLLILQRKEGDSFLLRKAGRRITNTLFTVQIILTSWFFINVALFPDCMAFQERLINIFNDIQLVLNKIDTAYYLY